MRKIAGIVLLIALICATVQLYGVQGTCEASIDCDSGWPPDPTAQCDTKYPYPEYELICYTYLVIGESESGYTIYANCTFDDGDQDACDF